MKPRGGFSDLISALLVVALLLFPSLSAGAGDPVVTSKTLQRGIDPVIVKGSLVKEVVGACLSNIRLYAYRNGSFEPIRFQIDEMDREGGDLILPDGPFPNSYLSNGKLDSWDILVFMAKDMGDKVPKELWTAGHSGGSEIEVVDPLTGGKGWAYLLAFASNPPPPSPLPEYVRYDYDTEAIWSRRYTVSYIVTRDGLHTTYYDQGTFPEEYGGNGQSIFDRLKIRTRVKMLFGTIALSFNEETLRCNLMAWKVGPVRLFRRLEQYVKLPGGRKALRVISDITYYETVNSCPIMLRVPFKLDTVLSSAVIRIGTEYTSAATGSIAMNSQNPAGFLVNGKMDDGEKSFNSSLDNWRVIYGDFGSFLCRTVFSPELLQHVKITQGIVDDATCVAPPEREPGAYGFMYQDWDITNLPGGSYTLFLEFYFPPHYKPGDEKAYVNYLDNPLLLRDGEQEIRNQNMLIPVPGEMYEKNRSYEKTVKATERFNKFREQTVDVDTAVK